MKFGYLLDFRQPADLLPSDSATFYRAMFEQVDFVDQAGFDSIWITEHHFVEDGYLAAAMPMLAAIAARTRNVTVGSYVILVPFYHPLRLAEDTALIDVIANGRLRLGLGIAYRLEEFEVFGVPRKERLGRTLETIEILKRAWTGERFSFAGKYFSFKDALVRPRPISRPYPELLWGGMAPEAIRRGARLDMGFACNLGAREIRIFHEALRELNKDPSDYSVVASRTVFVADSEEEAWRTIEPYLMYQMRLYGEWLAAGQITTGHFKPDREALRRGAIIGPPATVAARLGEFIANSAATEVVITSQLPGLEPAKAMRSLQRFTTEVLPALRAAPQRS
ncbi:MAG TPA: LLM class flavin-dependent oxidoreductase [Candidatus Binataceae bacterium]|nr:LLM class flavin-dependent oxidoreductase [Candidatus Binataceae bacterium]